ncbi:Hypothetical predicted protein, partial [Paramuricea clavata]
MDPSGEHITLAICLITKGILWPSYYKRYLELVNDGKYELVLLRIAKEIDLSPCILARIILEEYLSHTYCQGESGKCNQMYSTTVSRFGIGLELNVLCFNLLPKDVLSHMIKDTSLIPNERLSREIQQ